MIELAPKSTTRHVTKFGGKNEYGEPIWRVVLAESVTVQRAGVFVKWPDGEITPVKYERLPNGTYREHRVEVKPESEEEGFQEVPKYPVKGWVMERWFPPHVFGTKEQWESHKGRNSHLPMLGPFPSRGDYWILGGPFERVPEIGDLENAIAQWEQQFNSQPATEWVFKRQIEAEREAEEQQYEKLVAELEQYAKSEISPIFKSTSLEAQRVRNEVQEQLGNASHLGAGQ